MLQIQKCDRQPYPKYSPHPKFGTIFAPHILRMDIDGDAPGRYEAQILPYGPEPMPVSNVTLHYGQSIFEGMKAYSQADGSVAIFRADLHAKRFVLSARRMAMPEIPEDIFIDCLKQYVAFESQFVPNLPEHSLYLRPLLIGKDEILKVGRSKKYSFYILSTIAGSYFQGGAVRPAKVLVNREFTRAYPGGLGEAKTSANYAASLQPQALAESMGCDQVLYLDGYKHETVDELGGMNFFVISGKNLITPKLNGCILNGVTRRSILEIASSLDLSPSEQDLNFSEILAGIESGKIQEAFACGTAAVVHPIGEFVYMENSKSKPRTIQLPQNFSTAKKLLSALSQIQRGQKPAPQDGWLFKT